MNKVLLIGRLTRDPELRQTPSGVSVCSFGLAVNRDYRQGDGERQTDFFNCTAWRGLGENVAKYQHKGSKVAVEGSIQIRNYEDNQGVKKTAVDIVCNNVEFLDSRSSSDDSGYVPDAPAPSAPAKRKPVLQAFDDDEDSPF